MSFRRNRRGGGSVRVLAVDPGRQKCGLAVCEPGAVLAHRVVPAADLAAAARALAAEHRVGLVLVGSSTGLEEARGALAETGVPLVEVDERGTTLVARARYFRDHPPRGWRRLLPRSLLTPPEPYDDYAAILLAEVYFAKAQGSDGV